MLKQLERLMELGIEAAPVDGMERHVVFARAGYAAVSYTHLTLPTSDLV